MTAKQVKAKAPFFWQAVEGAVYADCKNEMKRYVQCNKNNHTFFLKAMNDVVCRKLAHNAAFIATSEFVSRGQRTPKKRG